MIPTILLAVHISMCGVHFDLPKGWTAAAESLDASDRATLACRLGLAPPKWAARNSDSPWSESAPAALYIFRRAASIDLAMQELGFYRNEGGSWISPSRDLEPRAAVLRFHGWRGWSGGGWHRGYVDNDKRDRLAPGESGVYSGNYTAWVARRGGRIAGLGCSDGTPVYPVDCEILFGTIFRSLH